jgi:uncharacterized protein (TIGR03083 family)
VSEPAPDYAPAYADLRARVTGLVRGRTDAELERTPPATPEWRVRDVVAHLVGVCDDVGSGNMAGVATDEWTEAQVAARRARPFDEVLAEWDERAPNVEELMRSMPIDAWGQMLADAATHEQDIRGALEERGGRDAPALVIGFEWGMHTLGQRLDHDGTGALRIEHEGGTTTVGSGEPATTLRANRFEVARAMAGRRSESQMHAYEWDGPFVDLVLWRKVFTPPEVDLIE